MKFYGVADEINLLHQTIKEFLSNKLGPVSFEEQFTDIFDFGEISADQNDFNYLQKVRYLLELYTSETGDI